MPEDPRLDVGERRVDGPHRGEKRGDAEKDERTSGGFGELGLTGAHWPVILLRNDLDLEELWPELTGDE